jgi:glutathione S-transferase
MYKAVGSPGSRVTRVLWMLEEIGQPYEIEYAKPQSPEARKYNASGKVPALVFEDFVLTDSAAICVYLGEKHPDAGMASRNLEERALVDSWMHFAQSELEAPLWNKLKHRLILPEEIRVDVGPWTGYEFTKEAKALARRLGEREFALGDRFTAVDIILGHIGTWARGAKFEIPSESVNAYFERVLARPAAKRAKEREMNAAA